MILDIYKYFDCNHYVMVKDLGKSIITLNKKVTLPTPVMKEMGLVRGDVIGFEKDKNGDVILVKYVPLRVSQEKEESEKENK